MKIRNRSKEEQAFANIPAFAVGEERDVDAPLARYLLNNPNMELVNPADEKKVWVDDSVQAVEAEGGSLEGVEVNHPRNRRTK